MPHPPTLRWAVCVAALAAAAAGCSAGGKAPPPSPEASHARACAAIPARLVSDTQHYIDGFSVQSSVPVGPVPSSGSPSPSPTSTPLTEQEFTDAVSRAREALGAQHCDLATFRADISAGLKRITSTGPVAHAVLAQLEVSLTGSLADKATTRTLAPTDDLPAAVAQAPGGSTLVLASGTYQLKEALVLLRGVTVVGAGIGRTTLTGPAPDATVLVLSDAPVVLRDLSLVRPADVSGSGIVTGPAAALHLTRVRIAGATAANGTGGAGVLLGSGSDQVPADRPTTLVVHNSELADNATGGLAVGGSHRVDISGTSFNDNKQCGVCFLGNADGTVASSLFRGNAVGISVGGQSSPRIRANTFAGGELALQANDAAAPIVLANTISGVSRASMLYLGQAHGRIDGNTCATGKVGIAVAKTAYPFVGTNTCAVTVAR